MEKLQIWLESLQIDYYHYGMVALILIAGSLLFGAAGRFVFGKRSLFGTAVSSAIAIVFLYVLTIVLKGLGAEYEAYTAPLPFVTLGGEKMTFFSFLTNEYPAICTQLLGMVILAFLVNLTDRFLPRGKNIFVWLIMRVLTVAIGLFLHLLATTLLGRLLPEGIAQYAPTVLLVLLMLMVLTGALKLLVGILISTVNPLIAALYTFFFANVVGRQITRAVLTTAILTLFAITLEKMGIAVVIISLEALPAYLPYGAGLLGLWYFVNRVF